MQDSERSLLPEDLDHGNSSPNGSVSSQGQESLSDQYNGVSDASPGLHRKRKRHLGFASDDEEADAHSNQITEEYSLHNAGVNMFKKGSAGRIRRSIISESGSLQVHYVKVLEKGDTYEIIERSYKEANSDKGTF
ncbi:hypothetical protein ZWY2020_024549 [Hordeum vulgare]|nr:hypothetical protein ZWY2020_024549 [Hordeum vulgare]